MFDHRTVRLLAGMARLSRISAVAVALVLGFTAAACGQAQPAAAPLSESDCALLSAFRSALERGEVGAATHDEILRQLRTQPPLALLEGYWVSPIDLLRLIDVAAGLDEASFAAAGTERPAQPRDLVAFAFSESRMRDAIPLPYVGDFGISVQRATGRAGLVVVPVKDSAEVVVEYLPPPIQMDEAECYYFCGEPGKWDFDGDGEPNATDPDDDADRVPDHLDAYPYWAGGSVCECGDRDFVGFTEKFSLQVTPLILSAYEARIQAEDTKTTHIAGGIENPPSIFFDFRSDQCAAAAPACPDANAPGVSYVSKDPDDCALVRFRCETGQEPFSNECGCGCRPSVR